jgi:predicted O-linked N-acetylglucosamine transferase (SPINDLY family)
MLKNFKNVRNLNNYDLKKLINNDKIDVLIECNGWSTENRFELLLDRTSPIQVIYYNIASTSGVKNADYNILSDFFEKSYIENFSNEKIIISDGCIIPYKNSLDIEIDIDIKTNDTIVFCCFGAGHKLNLELLETWSEILKKVPNSKLYIKNANLDIEDYKIVYKKTLSKFFNLDQIFLDGYSEYKKLLETYNKCHIHLDTFPHINGTTTIDASYMGLPTITMIGERICSQNNTILSFQDDRLIAKNKAEYIQKAIYLANNPDLITIYKRTLREKVFKRFQPKNNAKNFENTLQKIINYSL